jgi:hypothetical protein
MSVCLRLLVLPSQVAPIYWCYLCWQHQYQPIQICLSRGKVYSFWQIFSLLQIGLIRVERTINNYKLHVFFIVTDLAPSPPPLPSVKVGTMRFKGGYSLYLPIIIVIIGAANRKYLKRRSAANGLQHHAYSVKRCLFNQLE